MTATPAILDADHVRGRSDTNAINTSPTWLANEDTNFSYTVEDTFRLRWRINNSGVNSAAPNPKLQVQKGGGALQDVTTSSTIAQLNSAASSSADGAATSRLLTAPTTFRAGSYDVNGSVTGPTLAADEGTEIEWGLNIIAADVANGDSLTFKLGTVSGTTIQQAKNISVSVIKVTSLPPAPAPYQPFLVR